MLAYNITKSAIMLVVDGADYTVPRTSLQAQPLMDELTKPQPDETVIAELIKKEYSPEAYSDGTIQIMKDGTVTYKGEKLPKALADKVYACYEDGVPFTNVLAFFDRLNANPSKRAVEELYTFLEHKSMPITPDGHFLSYKGVQEDGYSVRGGDASKLEEGTTNDSGQIRNHVGDKIRMRRNAVDDNKEVGCSEGLHAGSLEYATGWGTKAVIVKIDPADVVSIPLDCSCQKLRTCAYEVVADYEGQLKNSGVPDASRPYDSDEVEEPDDDDLLISVGMFRVAQAPGKTVQQLCQEACESEHERGEHDAEVGARPDTRGEIAEHCEFEYPELWAEGEDALDCLAEAYYKGYRSA